MTDEIRSKKHSFHRVAFKCVSFMLLPSPSVVDESLITLADGNRNASFYVHDSTQTNVGGGVGRRRKPSQKLYKLTSDRKSLTISILDETRLTHKWR